MEAEKRVRTEIYHFVQEAVEADIANEFRALRNGREPSPQHEDHVDIDYESYADVAPVWLNGEAYIEELVSFSAPELWNNLLRHQPRRHRELTSLLPAIPGRYRTIGHAIEFPNHFLFTRAVVLLGMAALMGERFDETLTEDIEDDGSFKAAQIMADGFGEPASSPEDLISRMQHMFQPKGSETEGAYPILQEHNAFVYEKKECPAQNMTKVIVETYGSMLREERYKEDLLKRIVRGESI